MPELTLTGKSGTKYTFEVHSLDTSFRPVAAVYAITKRTPKPDGSGTHDVIYIGQTGELSDRFDSHHKASCFKSHQATSACIHQDTNEKSRLDKESDLIGAYNPPCNG